MSDDDEGLTPVLAAVRGAYPSLVWESAQRIDEGWDHVVLILRGCSGDDALGHRDLVFRFPTDEHAYGWQPDEIVILGHVAEHVDAAMPRYSHVPDGSAGPAFAGYPLVRGDRLTPDLLDSLPTPERTTLVAQLGATLAGLHALDTSSSSLERVPAPYQPENLDFVRRGLVTDLPEVLTADELRTAREICHEVAALQAADLPRVVLHNDVCSRHLYWERGAGTAGSAPAVGPGRLGIIDFSDLCLGDPAVDFAELYEYGPRFVDEVLAHYVGRIEGPPGAPDFLDRAWTYQRLAGLYLMAAHLFYGEETWEDARAVFDRCRERDRPRA